MSENEVLHTEQIMKILAHRFPFLLIDRVIRLDPEPGGSWVGRKAIAIKNVTINEPFFTGHFPHKPIMPGVLIIESLAQTAAVVGYRPFTPGGHVDVMIASINKARFRKPVVPGDQLKLSLEILKDRGNMFSFHGEAHVDDQLVAEADLLALSMPQKV